MFIEYTSDWFRVKNPLYKIGQFTLETDTGITKQGVWDGGNNSTKVYYNDLPPAIVSFSNGLPVSSANPNSSPIIITGLIRQGTNIAITGSGTTSDPYVISTSGTGTVTSVSAGTGMSFVTITSSGAVAIDTTKVPFILAGFSNGLLKWNGTSWVFDTNTYLTSISGLNISLLTNDSGYITSAALSGLVPYTGATANVVLGLHSLFASSLGATDLISPAITSCGLVYTDTSGNLTIDIADLCWDDTNKYLGVHTSTPNYPIDIHNLANNMLALNNTGTGSSFILFQQTATTKWKVGNNNSVSNTFEIQNVGTLSIPITIDGTTNDVKLISNINLDNQTASTIASFDASKNVVSLPLTTYPSLVELSYVKGLTSSVQTQINTKFTTPSGTTSQYVRGDGSLAAFPSIPSITGLVPYTGANSDVVLGVYTLTTPTLYGSAVASGGLTLNSTSNATKGTIQIGSTDIVNIGNKATTSQRLLRIGQDLAWVDIGSLVGATSQPALYLNTATPSVSNPALYSTADGTSTYLNGSYSVNLSVAGSAILSLNKSANIVMYAFNPSNVTGNTAGAELPVLKIASAIKTLNAGALTTQRFVYLQSQTLAFTSASTATNVYGFWVEPATAGANCTITNNYSAGFNGNVQINGNISGVTLNTYTSTIGGYTVAPTQSFSYTQIGKILNLSFNITGTSTATTFTYTLPSGVLASRTTYYLLRGTNNGATVQVCMRTNAGSNTVDLFTNISLGAWTGSGTKECSGSVMIETQ